MIQGLIFALIAYLFLTRFLSGQKSTPRKLEWGEQTIAAVPYWIAGVGHVPSLLASPENTFRKLRRKFDRGIFTLNLGGYAHTFIFRPSLASHFDAQKRSVADPAPTILYLLRTCFAFPEPEVGKLQSALEELRACDEEWLLGQGKQKMMDTLVAQLRGTSQDFVTFSKSPVDQMPWERTSEVDPPTMTAGDGTPQVEADIFALIRNFVAHNIAATLFGQDLLRANPSLLSDLFTLDSSLEVLATGLPRWLPWPANTSAHIALHRLHSAFTVFETALSAHHCSSPETDNVVSPYVQARQKIYARHAFSPAARASCDIALLSALVASASLVYWTMIHLSASSADTVEHLRPLLSTAIQWSKPDQAYPTEPTRLKAVDTKRLDEALGSAYEESVRLYSVAWSSAQLSCDLILAATRDGRESFLLRQGEFVHVAHNSFADGVVPDWSASPSQIDLQAQEAQSVSQAISHAGRDDTASIRPRPMREPELSSLGLFARIGQGENFVRLQTLAITGVLLALWDFVPLNTQDGHVMVPGAKDRGLGGIKIPIASGRAHIRKNQKV